MKYKERNRSKEGTRACVFGLICNLILAAAKFFIGMVGNSIIIIADAAHTLTDGISAMLAIFGFCMEANGKDERHPYGHGRIEYVMGFLISLMLFCTGFNVGKEAVMRIFHPEAVAASTLTIIVVAFCILVKLGMALYYGMKNKDLKSPAIEAVRKDSLMDACVSSFTLAGLLIMPHTTLPLDGILGLVMAGYIICSGAVGLRDNLAFLLGEGPSQKTENELRKALSECAEIESVEEITVHDYGPNKKIAVAAVNFAKSSDKEAQSKMIGDLIRFCKDTMGIELSLYSPLY